MKRFIGSHDETIERKIHASRTEIVPRIGKAE